MDNEIVQDSENYKSKDKVFGFREIVMKQFQKVISNTSQEMKEGFFIYSEGIQNQKIKYFGDTRISLIRSIDALMDILEPKWIKEKNMKDMNTKLQEINKRIEDLDNDYDANPGESDVTYFSKLLKEYRLLFKLQCAFLDRLGWLEETSVDN
jgi:hypothetical protein